MIAGMGFAQMAWKEAQRRTGLWKNTTTVGMHRGSSLLADQEYYRICDKAWHAFKHREQALATIRKMAPNTGNCLWAVI